MAVNWRKLSYPSLVQPFWSLTLMLLVANFDNAKLHKKAKKNDWKPGIWVLIWEFSARAIQWIPTWKGLDSFQKSLWLCALDESSFSIGRVNLLDYPTSIREANGGRIWLHTANTSILEFCHLFWLIEAKSWLTSCKRREPECPANTTSLLQVIGNFLTCRTEIRNRAVVRDS